MNYLENNGHFSNTETVWHTGVCGNSVRIFHLEAEQVHSRRLSTRLKRKVRTLRNDNHKTNRPTEANADRVGENKSKLSLISIHIDKNNSERTTKISKLGE